MKLPTGQKLQLFPHVNTSTRPECKTQMHQGHQELEGLQAPHMLGVHKGTQEQVQGGQPTVGPSLLWTRASL